MSFQVLIIVKMTLEDHQDKVRVEKVSDISTDRFHLPFELLASGPLTHSNNQSFVEEAIIVTKKVN